MHWPAICGPCVSLHPGDIIWLDGNPMLMVSGGDERVIRLRSKEGEVRSFVWYQFRSQTRYALALECGHVARWCPIAGREAGDVRPFTRAAAARCKARVCWDCMVHPNAHLAKRLAAIERAIERIEFSEVK